MHRVQEGVHAPTLVLVAGEPENYLQTTKLGLGWLLHDLLRH